MWAVKRSNRISKEQWLGRCRRAERSYSTFKVIRGNLVQGKEQWLCFAGAAEKSHAMWGYPRQEGHGAEV